MAVRMASFSAAQAALARIGCTQTSCVRSWPSPFGGPDANAVPVDAITNKGCHRV